MATLQKGMHRTVGIGCLQRVMCHCKHEVRRHILLGPVNLCIMYASPAHSIVSHDATCTTFCVKIFLGVNKDKAKRHIHKHSCYSIT
jgi:hypothetical protein